MSVTAKLEKQILSWSCSYPKYRLRAVEVLGSGGCFGDYTMSWFWRELQKLPRLESVGRTAMMALVELQFGKDPEKEELHATAVDQIFEQETDEKLVSFAHLEVLVQLSSHAALEKVVVEASGMLDKGDVKGAWDHVLAVRKQRTNGKGMRRVDYAESIPERFALMKSQEGPSFTVIPTRIKSLDRYIDGIRLGELGIVVATTGRGKSITTMNFAAASAAQGFVTAVFNTEMWLEQAAMRFDSHFMKVEHRKFKTWAFSEEEENQLAVTVDSRMNQLAGKLFLYDTPIRECSLENVENEVLQLEDDIGEKVKLLVIDSPAHFKPKRSYEQKRHEMSDIFWELKGVARGEGVVEHAMALWVTDQAKVEYEHKVAGATATSESADKSRIADLVITLNQDDGQEVNGELVLALAKARDSQAHVQVRLRTMYSIMGFEELGEVERIRTDLISDLTGGK